MASLLLREIPDLNAFKSEHKSYLFRIAFNIDWVSYYNEHIWQFEDVLYLYAFLCVFLMYSMTLLSVILLLSTQSNVDLCYIRTKYYCYIINIHWSRDIMNIWCQMVNYINISGSIVTYALFVTD